MRYDTTSVPDKYHDSRALTAADVDHWVRLVEEVLPRAPGAVLLDLGCGTGRFTVPLADRLGIPVVGVDPSQKMLVQAARHAEGRSFIEYREGSAESIPSEVDSAALIFMSNAIHHVRDIDRALQEMRRVLQPHGVVFIRNYVRENLASLPYPRFFPEAMQVSRDMLSARDTVVEQFTTRGFLRLTHGTVRQVTALNFEAYVEKVSNRVYSDLALIPDEAFERGLAQMKDARASFDSGAVLEDVDYFVFERAGRR